MGAAVSEPIIERCQPACVETCPELAQSSHVVQQRPRPRQYLAAAAGGESPAGGGKSPLLEAVGARFGWVHGVDAEVGKPSEPASGSRSPYASESPKGEGGRPARLPAANPDDDLQHAAVRGDLTKVKRALDNKASVACANVRGTTPLMLASSSNGREAMEVLILLLDGKADLEATDHNGWRSMHHACRNGKTEVVKQLLAQRAEAGPRTTDHRTTLMLAVMDGKPDLVKELLKVKEVKAQAMEKDALSVSALHCAAKAGSTDIAKLLIESNARANMVDIEGRTPLMWACQHGRLDCAKVLVKANGDIHIRDKTERSSIWYACMNSSEGVAMWLLKKWADPRMQDILGDSPLSLADELGLSKFKKAAHVGTAEDENQD